MLLLLLLHLLLLLKLNFIRHLPNDILLVEESRLVAPHHNKSIKLSAVNNVVSLLSIFLTLSLLPPSFEHVTDVSPQLDLEFSENSQIPCHHARQRIAKSVSLLQNAKDFLH